MSAPSDPSIDALIDSLAAYDTIKVWSWLTTIFGDLAQQPGDELSGSVLGQLSERISIRPEAMRVALHRLRKDGWIVARKEGRNSFYRLSDRALYETLEASRRIYAAEIAVPTRWHVLLINPAGEGEPPEPAGYARINDACFLGVGPRPDVSGGLALEFAVGEMPNWMADAVAAQDADAPFRPLAKMLAMVESGLSDGVERSSCDRIVLRLLVLHHWRRAVLRTPLIVEQVRGADWIGADCRRRCAAIFQTLPRGLL